MPNRLGLALPIPPDVLATRPPLSRAISEHRIAAGISQRALAELVGVNPAWMSDIERGLGKPSASLLAQIKDVLQWTE
jgi:transcriptional regulator with XRE-family HTH domain